VKIRGRHSTLFHACKYAPFNTRRPLVTELALPAKC